MVCRARDFAAAALVALLAGRPALAQLPAANAPPQYQLPAASPAPQAPPWRPTADVPQSQPTAGPAPLPGLQPAGPTGPPTTWPWLQSPSPMAAAPSGLTSGFGMVTGPSIAQHCNADEDCNANLLHGDPLLDAPIWAPPGWFAGLEADLVASHIENRLGGAISNGDFIHLPTAGLPWTVAPRIELGYRFGEGAGELILAYKFLITSGAESLPAFGGPGDAGELHSHLNINAWDFDYGSREYSLLPDWDMKWRAGVRLGAVFFDSTATSPLLEQREVNNFVGAGPHWALDLRRVVRGSGIELFGRIENAWLIGDTDQSYQEVPVGGAGGAGRTLAPLVVPWLGVEAGVGWTPPGNEHLYFAAGYTWETWWNLADTGGTPGPTAVITNQGVFFRLEVRY